MSRIQDDYQAAGYHHDQQEYQHKHNRGYGRPFNNRAGFRGRGRGGYYHNRDRHYNRDGALYLFDSFSGHPDFNS